MGDDVLRMVRCGLAVAAVAVPVGLVGWRLARRPLRPPVRPWRVPWSGADVFLAFFVLNLVVPAVAFETVTRWPQLAGDDSPQGRAVRVMWVGVLAFPFQLGLMAAAWALYPPGRVQTAMDPGVVPGRVALGVLVWAGLTPVVLLVHGGVGSLFRQLGWPTQDHPLAGLTDGPGWLGLLFLLQAGVAAPAVEELLFRGVLLGWLVGGRSLIPRDPTAGRDNADTGAMVVLSVGAVLVVVTTRDPAGGPVVFACGLGVGWLFLRQLVRRKRRTLGAVYASAALFAEVHSAVWPSPVPLFVLGLGLGWLAVRTRGVVAPVVVHGLFNAVSVVFVLGGRP